jgi:uncharacterized protein with PIN domain
MGFPNTRVTGASTAVGQNVAPDPEFFDDFIAFNYEDGGTMSTTAELGHWLSTETNTGSVVTADDEPGGVLHITTDTADNDGYEMQLNGESFKVASGKDIYFECRLKLTAAASPLTTIDWCVGLATTDTAVMDGTEEFIGFGTSNGSGAMLNAGAANIYAIAQNDTGSAGWGADDFTDTGVDWVDDTFFTVAFHVIGNGRIKFFVNGNEKHNTTSNIPDGDAVTPTICIQNNAAAAKQMLVDYIYVVQKR